MFAGMVDGLSEACTAMKGCCEAGGGGRTWILRRRQQQSAQQQPPPMGKRQLPSPRQ
jgi:hypothetical protein